MFKSLRVLFFYRLATVIGFPIMNYDHFPRYWVQVSTNSKLEQCSLGAGQNPKHPMTQLNHHLCWLYHLCFVRYWWCCSNKTIPALAGPGTPYIKSVDGNPCLRASFEEQISSNSPPAR